LAKSDEEFDKIYADFIALRDKNGYTEIQAYKQQKYEEYAAKRKEFSK
jgi:putative aldouronate transport system substrate-binding protein